MRRVHDSFVQFLIDELTGYTINHILEADKDYPDNSNIQINAVNIKFLGITLDRHINQQLTSLDVTFDTEYNCIAAVEALQDLLMKRFFIEQKDYTNPATPTKVDGNIFWEDNALDFRRIPNPYYTHYSATFFLKFYRTLA